MPEPHDNAARITAVSGVLFVVFFLVGSLVFNKSGYPDSNDGAAKIGAYMVEHRDAMLSEQFLFGLGFLSSVCFTGGVTSMLWRTAAARPLAVIGAVGGAAGAGMGMVGSAMLTLLAYRPPVGDPGLMISMLDGAYITFNSSGFLVAAFIGAASIAAVGLHALPAWTGRVGIPVAILQIVAAASWAKGDGAFSPQGLVTIIALLAVMVWTICVAVAVRRPMEAATPAPTAPAPA
jgi:hypothetical protein